MGGTQRVVRTIVGAALACALVASLAFASGCSPQVTDSAAAEETGQSLGPLPLGVGVSLGDHKLTMESVEISNLDMPWPAGASSVPVTPAAAGKTYVHANFVIHGKPDLGTNGYLGHPELIVDGKSVPIGEVATQWDQEPPPGTWPKQSLSFQVPADARSVVVRVQPSFAETQSIDFRIW